MCTVSWKYTVALANFLVLYTFISLCRRLSWSTLTICKVIKHLSNWYSLSQRSIVYTDPMSHPFQNLSVFVCGIRPQHDNKWCGRCPHCLSFHGSIVSTVYRKVKTHVQFIILDDLFIILDVVFIILDVLFIVSILLLILRLMLYFVFSIRICILYSSFYRAGSS